MLNSESIKLHKMEIPRQIFFPGVITSMRQQEGGRSVPKSLANTTLIHYDPVIATTVKTGSLKAMTHKAPC